MSTKAIAHAMQIARAAHAASPRLMTLARARKDAILRSAAAILRERQPAILAANEKDLRAGERAKLAPAMLDRLRLTPARVEETVAMALAVADLPDPAGTTLAEWTRPNGLVIRKVSVPLGTILIIYEARPNVTVECASLCLKSGNTVLLRGGSEAAHSNQALAECFQTALKAAGLPPASVGIVPAGDRQAIYTLLKQTDLIQLVIPRGGPSLIRSVTERSRIPVIKHYMGICHVYVDASADCAMAERIVLNAKCQRPGVCNAMETLLVHRPVAEAFLPRIAQALFANGCTLYGCPATRKILGRHPQLAIAKEEHFRTEYLDLKCSVRVVDDVQTAVRHIMTYGSQHTDAIIASDPVAIETFTRDVDSSSVMVNTTTRFSDGFQYGFGAEIGISTDKLHARGPMGLDSLTSYKYIVVGAGQLRN
ncbi:MAG: glutamate-5-semialdehyde dehydrogenase [Deltaproteobacteria bacterium]|nr:glutamate-5-semialdehyde dehydrogenase [Deltaproteobacteria bacterium]